MKGDPYPLRPAKIGHHFQFDAADNEPCMIKKPEAGKGRLGRPKSVQTGGTKWIGVAWRKQQDGAYSAKEGGTGGACILIDR